MNAALTIAGSDSSGGAGIQADLKTFAAHGVHGVCAVTAVTAQNARGLRAGHVLPAEVVAAQIEAGMGDFPVAAAKTGMLGSAAIVEVVAASVDRLRIPRLVVDPVVMSGRGDRLLDDDGIALLKDTLLSRACAVTPNRMEAERLADTSIASLADAREAARRIHDLGPGAVVITGGHLGEHADEVIDIVYDGHDLTEHRQPRLSGGRIHGAGCTFAAAITAALALDQPLVEAARAAQRYVASAIRHGPDLGRGGRQLLHFCAPSRR